MNGRQISVEEAFKEQSKDIKNTSDLQLYIDMMNSLDQSDCLTEDFKNKFIRFYKLRRNEDFRDTYFNLLQEYNDKFENSDQNEILRTIIEELQKAPGNIELSFATKLMTTADKSTPIWDSYVEAVIKQWSPEELSEANKLGGIDAAIAKFELLTSFYKELKENGETQVYIDIFDEVFPNSGIPDTKKVDYVLWLYGKQLVENKRNRKKATS